MKARIEAAGAGILERGERVGDDDPALADFFAALMQEKTLLRVRNMSYHVFSAKIGGASVLLLEWYYDGAATRMKPVTVLVDGTALA